MKNNKDFQNLKRKEHLKKDFGAELNYKLWVTKGVRFIAAKRLEKQSNLSVFTIALLSAYIIILNLFVFIPNLNLFRSNPEGLTIFTISLSILVLVFSQIESLRNYNLKAEKLHTCAKEIGKLYNEWRYYKTCINDIVDINSRIIDISKRYEFILDKYDNHDDVDIQLFKAKHNKDFFEYSFPYVPKAHITYYIKVYFIYHLLIGVPIILFFIYLILKVV